MLPIHSKATKCLIAAFLLAAGVSCKKEDSKTNPNPSDTTTHPTGWFGGTEKADTVPKNLNIAGDPKLGNNDALPPNFDLTQYLPPVGDQGQFGTCVAWATAYNCKSALEAIKYSYTSATLANTDHQMSPKDLFMNIADADKGATDCNGTNFTVALDVVLNRGVATMSVAPYTGMGNCSKANADAAWNASAAKHKIARYRRIDPTKESIKQELVNKNLVILGARLADNFMSWGTSDVVYSNHSSFDQVGIHSYHAMCIVGYDDSKGPKGAFKVVNSWSPTWGNAGFIWVDQDFMVANATGADGFMFDKNLFTAGNADQNPDSSHTDPIPTPTGVDLMPWVSVDFSNPDEEPDFPTRRDMLFDIYNLGNATASVTSQSGYAYLYYSAYDANDYGVVFFDQMNQATAAGTYSCHAASASSYAGCLFNGSIAPLPNGSLGVGIFGAPGAAGIHRWYYMPETLNGTYYLVMVADVNEKFSEQDESNNLFYTTDQYPLDFSDGIELRRSTPSGWQYSFRNPLGAGAAAAMNPAGKRFRTAVNRAHPNAYSPQEIVGFLKKEIKTGGFAVKLQEYKARVANLPHGVEVARK